MYTTIKLSTRLKQILDSMKVVESESYENLIEDLVEDHLTLNPEFERSLEKAMREYKEGKVISLQELKARSGR